MKNQTKDLIIHLVLGTIFLVIGFMMLLSWVKDNIEVANCIDGDTFSINDRYYRLAYIDTPEKGEPKYKEASEFTCNYIKYSGEKVLLSADGLDIYHRILVIVSKPYYGTETLNEELIKNCLAEPFYGKTTDDILNLYNKNCK